jgi:hypothetical protein
LGVLAFLMLAVALYRGLARDNPSDVARSQALENQAPVPLLEPTWSAPRSDWIYVLDTNDQEAESQLLLVDPSASQIRGAIRLGHNPEMSLAPDGAFLYVGSGEYDGSGRIAAIKTSTSREIWRVPFQGYGGNIIPQRISRFALITDATSYLIVPRKDKDGVIALIDATAGTRTNNEAGRLPDCGRLISVVSSGSSHSAYALCHGTDNLFALTPTGQSLAVAKLGVSIPDVERPWRVENNFPVPCARCPEPGILNTVLLSDVHQRLYGLTHDGRIGTVSLEKNKLESISDLGLADHQLIPHAGGLLSPDQSRLYAVVKGPEDCPSCRGRGAGQHVMAFETGSWQKVGEVTLPHPVFNMGISIGGDHLFALDLIGRRISVIRLQDFTIEKTVEGLGNTPSLQLVAK